MLGDVTIYANGKAVMVLRGGKVLNALPGYTARVVRQGLGPGRGRGRGWGQAQVAAPGLKGDPLFGMGEESLFGPVDHEEAARLALEEQSFGAVIPTLPLYANLDTEAEMTQKTFSDDDATQFEGVGEEGGGLF